MICADQPRCPECGDTDYGPLDIGWPWDAVGTNPRPELMLIVMVCLACGHVTGDDGLEPEPYPYTARLALLRSGD